MKPHSITKAHIVAMFMPWRERKLAPKTQRQYNGRLRYLLRFLGVAERLVQTIPHIKAVAPRGVIVQREVIEQVLGAAPPHLRLYLLLCSDTCIRSGTVVQLTEQNWNPETEQLCITTKANAVVTLPTSERLARLIREAVAYPASPETPLVQRLGGPVTRWRGHAYGRQLKMLLKNLGLPAFTSHDLRRSQARRMYETTKDLRLAQAILGHSNIASTFYYLMPHIKQVTREQITVAAQEAETA